MEPRNDEVFGHLEFHSGWRREFSICFLGVEWTVDLIVEGNDVEETIRDEQRSSFQELCNSEAEIVSTLEDALFGHYHEVCDYYRSQFGTDADIRMPIIQTSEELAPFVEVTGIIFPMVLSDGERTLGLLGECSWDPEHGIGIKLTNGQIEVGGQDLLT